MREAASALADGVTVTPMAGEQDGRCFVLRASSGLTHQLVLLPAFMKADIVAGRRHHAIVQAVARLLRQDRRMRALITLDAGGAAHHDYQAF
jgi:hypothetical protein